ncbi:unnamed protein product, partial [marine sediment metagenome]
FAQVKDYLKSNYYMELSTGQQINMQHIKEAIMSVRGSDPRTVKKWIKVFHKFDLIKPVAGNIWEIM